MGQFVDHDITLTPEMEEALCCSRFGHIQDSAACTLVDMPCSEKHFTDEFLERNGDNPGGHFGYGGGSTGPFCKDRMVIIRSLPFCGRVHGQREQMNGITAFVDASNVYGSTVEESLHLRTMEHGMLKVSDHDLLPKLQNEEREEVHTAGDVRAREMDALASMHTVFVREHNRICKELAQHYGIHDDEKIYQIARRIVGAEMQNVVFGQYLEIILGTKIWYDEKISPLYCSKYDPEYDPSIKNAFATAAFRFGHSMIAGLAKMINLITQTVSQNVELRETFFDLSNYVNNGGSGMEEILNGLIQQSSLENDPFVDDSLTNHLFANNAPPGSDLFTRNIQIGRDHGLPGYNEFREYCGLPRICNWMDKPEEINFENWQMLYKLYDSPSDIDLFTAGLAEMPYNGGVVGRTFNCLIKEQFHRLKFGDRYFFTHEADTSLKTHPFTEDQLDNLRNRNLGDILCDNTQFKESKKNVFRAGPLDMKCDDRTPLKTGLFV